MPKARKKKTKNRNKTRTSYLIVIVILLALYCLVAFIAMPLYTRHWQRVHVPDVTNLSVVAAEKVIKHNKLVAIRGEAKYDDSIPAGYVSFQNPLGNSYVKKGRRIYLVSSRGKRPVIVPNLVGTNVRDARFNIVQQQLELGKISYDFDHYYPEGVVMNQAIEPDQEIMAGSVLDITVSMGEPPDKVYIPNIYGKSLEEAELLLKKSLLTKGRVSYRESTNSAPNLVIYQSVGAGRLAAVGDTVNIALSKMEAGGENPW